MCFLKSWNSSTKPGLFTKTETPPPPTTATTHSFFFSPFLAQEILQLSCLIASCFSFPYLSQVVMAMGFGWPNLIGKHLLNAPNNLVSGQLGWTPPGKWLHQEKDVTIFHESSWVSSQQKTSHKGKYESDESLHPGHHLSSAFSMIPERVLHSKKTSSRIFLGAKFLVGRNVAAEGASMPLKRWRSAAAMK